MATHLGIITEQNNARFRVQPLIGQRLRGTRNKPYGWPIFTRW
jgi:hypothetical protein